MTSRRHAACVAALLVLPTHLTFFSSLGAGEGAREDTWTSYTQGLPDLYVGALAIDWQNPLTLYAGTTTGVAKSVDGGETWEPRTDGLPEAGINVGDLAIDPTSPETVYLASWENGIFRTDDGAARWYAISAGLPTLNANKIAIHPADPSVLFCGPDGWGTWRSIDGGDSWHPSGPGRDVRQFAVERGSEGTLYATTVQFVQFTIDGGETWDTLSQGLPNPFLVGLAVDPVDPRRLYCGPHEAGVYRSTDGGRFWSLAGTGIPAKVTIRCVAVDPHDHEVVYAAGGPSGIFRSSDGGETWEPFNDGLEGQAVNLIVVHPTLPGVLYAGTREGGVFRRGAPLTGPGGMFRRGDPDGTGRIELTDGVFTLNWLFRGGPQPACRDAADADDSGAVELTDAVYLLRWLFSGGPPPPAPGPGDCGADPTPDPLDGCEYPPAACPGPRD